MSLSLPSGFVGNPWEACLKMLADKYGDDVFKAVKTPNSGFIIGWWENPKKCAPTHYLRDGCLLNVSNLGEACFAKFDAQQDLVEAPHHCLSLAEAKNAIVQVTATFSPRVGLILWKRPRLYPDAPRGYIEEPFRRMFRVPG